MKKNIKLILLSILSLSILILSGCTTVKKNEQVSKKVLVKKLKFTGKIKDLKKRKTYPMKMDMFIKRDDSFRAEIKGPLNLLSVASVLYKSNEQFVGLNHLEKKYVSGEATEENFKKITELNIHPKHLVRIMDREIPDVEDWQCAYKENALSVCRYKTNNKFMIQFLGSSPYQEIKIQHPDFLAKLELSSTDSFYQKNEKLWTLTPPQSYKKIDEYMD